MSKRKCAYCGERKEKAEGVIFNINFFCDISHAIEYGRKNAGNARAKATKEQHSEEKRVFKANDRRLRKKALVMACHAYIRERDKNNLCICCNKPLGSNYHAGHFKESGNNPLIRYNEDNIHAQSLSCNVFKGGDSGDYEKNLRIRIGGDRVDYLLSMTGGTCTMTAQDMAALESEYKNKLKTIKTSKGD